MPPTVRATRRLTVTDHGSDVVAMRYVYPVVSRRAGGVSVGVNLNPNSACNWRCVYCQVEGLTRGAGPRIDLGLLERELDAMLGAIVEGDFMSASVPEGSRVLRDVAFSGDGEPTTSPDLGGAVACVGRVLSRRGLALPAVLITNGSMLDRRAVRSSLAGLAAIGGEAWFKLDAATDEGIRRMNGAATTAARHLARLAACASIVPTWVQTCALVRDGAPEPREADAYVDALAGLVRDGVPLRGVRMYSLARPSHQPEAPSLAPAARASMDALAGRLRAAGLAVQVAP